MHCMLIPCFFWHDIDDLDGVIAAVASTFGFRPSDIWELELSYERLSGLFYWQELAERLAAEVERAAQGGK